jgi:hypothetical protein
MSTQSGTHHRKELLMNASKTAEIKRIAAHADQTITLHSDLKQSAIDESLRDLNNSIKRLLRSKRCEISVLVVSDAMK